MNCRRNMPDADGCCLTRELRDGEECGVWGRLGAMSQGALKSLSLLLRGYSFGREVSRLSVELVQEEVGLEKFVAVLEQRFLALGTALQNQVALSDDLVEASRLLEVIDNNSLETGCPVNAGIALAAQALDRVVASWNPTQHLLGTLREVQVQMVRLQKTEDDWSHISLPLKTAQILFRMESASLGGEVESSFSLLAEGISGLHQKITSAVRHEYQSLELAREHLDGLIYRLEHQVRDHDLAMQQRDRLRGSLSRLGHQAGEERAWRQSIVQHAQKVAGNVSQVVVGLQFQDVTRQKMEHVRSALGKIRASLSSGSNPTRSAFNELKLACRVQVRQIEAVRADLAKAESRIASGIREILDNVEAMRAESLGGKEVHEMVLTTENVVKVLLEVLHGTETLVQHSLSDLEFTKEAMDHFGQVLANVTGTVGRLAGDLRMMAVNAQVQASQMGAGTGFEVLTEFTCRLSDQTGRFSERLRAEISSMAKVLGDISVHCDKARREAQGQKDHFGAEAAKQRKALPEYQARVRAALDQAAVQLDRIGAGARDMMPILSFSDMDGGCLARLQNNLTELFHHLSRKENRGGGAQFAGELEGFEHDYTMESERRVHLAAVGEDASRVAFETIVPTVRNGRPRVSANEIPKLGANVLRPSTSAPPRNANSSTFGDDVELF